MTSEFSGNYPIERRLGEIERLHIQSKAMAPDTLAMLKLFGPMNGWSCLDIGCGPGGITDILSELVGPSGRVVGIDLDEEFIRHARVNAPSNVEFVVANAYNCDLPHNSFDFVHMRFVASTAGSPERLINEACRLARRGGIVALQEPDGSTLHCYPHHAAWDHLKAALLAVFKGVGADLELARRLYHLVFQLGLQDVQLRTALLGVRSIDPMVDYLPSTVELLRASVMKLNLMTEAELSAALAECRKHLSSAGTSFTMYTVAQVWGRTP